MPIPCGNEPISLDRSAHLRRDLDFLEKQLDDPGSLLVPVWHDQNLIVPGTQPSLVTLPLSKANPLLDIEGELVWLGRLGNGETSCFALDLSGLHDPFEPPAISGKGDFVDIRNVMGQMSSDEAGLGAYARGILYWHNQHAFCGACGRVTEPRQGGHLRVCTSPQCGKEHFPRTDPSVMVLVTHEDRCLLGRQPHWIESVYSAIAGFVEPGESLEGAAIREVREEVGIDIEPPRYFSSQPWPFPASLMLGFDARAQNDVITLDGQELEDARWYTRDELRNPSQHGFLYPGTYSLAGRLIEAFMEQALP
jgi:NAD+ diphosphatase